MIRWTRHRVSFVSFLLGCLLVLGMWQISYGRTPQTVKVYMPANGYGGTGVLCGGTPDGKIRCVMTVAHVTGPAGTKAVVPYEDYRYEGTVVGADRRSDAAMVIIHGHEGPISRIPNARLWLGDLRHEHTVRTEGWSAEHGGSFRVEKGNLVGLNGRHELQFRLQTYSGMSGGPSFLVGKTIQGQPAFVTTTTGYSYDGRGVYSMGPYRTFFRRWIPTLRSEEYSFALDDQTGLVKVTPTANTGLIEGAIAQQLPGSLMPESQDEPATDLLKQQLLGLLSQKQEQPETQGVRPKIDPAIKGQSILGQKVTVDHEEEVFEVPLKIIIRRNKSMSIEVTQ